MSSCLLFRLICSSTEKRKVLKLVFFDFNISDLFDITEKLNTISIFHIITDVVY